MESTPDNSVSNTKTVELEQVEFDMAHGLIDSKDKLLHRLGLQWISMQQTTNNYMQTIQGEQQFMQSLATKYEMPVGSLMRFGKDGTLTAEWSTQPGAGAAPVTPPAPASETSDPPAETPEDESGESA